VQYDGKKAFLYVEPKNDIPVVRYDGGTHANILTLSLLLREYDFGL